jgi:hypothetical protein
MGRNLLVHLRTNLTARIRRSALAAALPAQLETAATLGSAAPQHRRAFICNLRPQHPQARPAVRSPMKMGDSTTSGTRMLRTAALFPTVGSANPAFAGVTLAARKAAEAIA